MNTTMPSATSTFRPYILSRPNIPHSPLTMTTKTLIDTRLDCAPALTAKLAPWIRSFTEQPELAERLVPSADSPVHVVVTSEFKRNVASLKSVFAERQLDGGLYFARKANKLPWFVTQAKEEGIGVDTASLNEVRETL